MNVIKCKNGHFFDGDSYQVCPHCGAPMETNTSSNQPEIKEKRRGLGLFGGHKTKGESFSQPQVTTQPKEQTANREYNPAADFSNAPGSDNSPEKKDATIDFWQTDLPVSSSEADPVEAASVEKKVSAEPQESPAPQAATSLRDAVKQASANSEGKTMSYFSAVTNGTDAGKKESTPASRRPADPVVGWLVCIQGEHFGESFSICAGMNSIGRSETNRIVLNRDPSVSREKHALITYEPKHRKFYVKPGDSSGLTYLNDEYITETKPISEHSIIELGNSRFLFVPLCGDDFTWEDYIKG